MLTPNEIMGNAVVTPEQFRVLDDELVFAARQNTESALRLVAPIQGTLADQRFDFDDGTELAAAQIDMDFTEGNEDTILQTRGTLTVPVISKKFRIGHRNLLSSRTSGTPLDTSNASSAAHRVGQGIGDIITQGWTMDGTNYDVPGLFQSAGNTDGTGNDFGTAGNPTDAVTIAMGLCMADNVNPPYHLSLNAVQWAELRGSDLTSGNQEFELVKDIIGGEILVNNDIVAGNGMLTAVPEQGWLKVFVGQDVTTEIWQASPDPRADTIGRVFAAMSPRIVDANAICTLTSI